MFQYSVAISPPDPVIEQVRQLKQQLRSAIGRYSSVNALAHITINLFRADAHSLAQWEAYITGFAAQQQPLPLQFDHTGAFPNGAFFLAPSQASEQQFIPIMKAFHRQAPLPVDATSVAPHMSIARRLAPDQLAIASALIPGADIRFQCSDIVLRRFNDARKQYDIYKRFAFEG